MPYDDVNDDAAHGVFSIPWHVLILVQLLHDFTVEILAERLF